MTHIKIQPEILSDGSSAWNVIFDGTQYDCYSKEDAYRLTEKIRDAIYEHTGSKLGLDEDWLITHPNAA